MPSFICADAFNKFLPFCTGFAAGCMIWMVVAEVLPDAFKVCASLNSYVFGWIHGSFSEVGFLNVLVIFLC